MKQQHIGSLSVDELIQREKENRQTINKLNESQLCSNKKDTDLLKCYLESVERARVTDNKRDIDRRYLMAYQNYLNNVKRYYLANGLKVLSKEQDDICLSKFAEECALIK